MIPAHYWKSMQERFIPSLRNEEQRRLLKAAVELLGVGDSVPDDIPLERLDRMIKAICDLLPLRSRIAAGNGAYWFWQLASKYQVARERLRPEYDQGKAHTRLFIVNGCMGNKKYGEAYMSLAKSVLRDALRDRSKEVRRFAADRCGWRDLHEMAPFLEAAIAVERDAKCLRNMQLALGSLVKGYMLHEHIDVSRPPSDETLIWVVLTVTAIGSYVPNEIVQKIGLDEAAARVRARRRDPTIPGDEFDPLPPEKQFLGAWPMQDLQPQELHLKPYKHG